MSKKTKNHIISRRLLAFLLMIAVFLQMAGLNTFASESGENKSVTRLEWLKALTETFEFTVEEDNYPDNYYSDIDADSPDYYDVMLATEFGLVDVEAGEALRPGDAATREFAAHTLNLCLGYVLEEETYTFSESQAVAYPQDIQIAINQGWFALVDGNFLPEQSVTQAEKAAMIAAAEAVLAQDAEQPSENTYMFKDNVIVLPEDTVIQSIDEDTLEITDCPAEIAEGDIFGIEYDGLPLAWKAVSVEKNENKTVITIDTVDTEEAFEEVDIAGEMEVDLAKLQPASEDATLRYVVGGTEENNYEDGTICESLEEVGAERVSAVIVEQTADMPAAYANSRAADKIKITAKITNLKEKHGLSLKGAYIDFNFKVELNCNVSIDILEAAGISPSNELFYAPILPGIYVKGIADMGLSGEIDIRLVENVRLGFHMELFSTRLTRSFKKDSFTITANATARAGVRVEAGFQIPGLSGKIYGKTGVMITAKTVHYPGELPETCQTISSYLYASAGYDVSVDVAFYKGKLASDSIDIYAADNSPVRTAFHYEDGKVVPECTRGASSGMGYGGGGYFSPINTKYYYDAGSSGVSDGNGNKVYTIFDYSLDKQNQATITAYRGTAVNVFVPETLDGYPVVGIGNNAFKDNKKIRSVSLADSVETIGTSAFQGCTALERVGFPDSEKFVIIGDRAFYGCSKLEEVELPDSVTEIGDSSFYGCSKLEEIKIPDSVTEIGSWAFGKCTELSDVKLSKKLEVMKYAAFGDCDKITKIEIPKSLKECSSYHSYNADIGGPFWECDELKGVTFEEGTTEVAKYLFEGCAGLEEIVIPDTVTVIEYRAFMDCVNLKQVAFSANITEIENMAFKGCIKLENVQIPNETTKIGANVFQDCVSLKEATISDSVASIGNYTFSGCTSLEKVHISNMQKSIPSYMFNECNSLSEINLPETLTKIENNAFYNCDALTELNLPSQLQTIGNNVFYDCDALTKVTMPSTVTTMGNYVFYHCDSLSEVSLGTGLTSLPTYAFAQCPKLTSIVLPYRMTKINDNAFNACTGLTEITMPRGMASIGNQVFSYPGKMTIYGIKGTYAETYANTNGITFVNREVNAEKVDINQTELKIGKGDKKQIFLTVTPSNFTDEVVWKSGNPEIATVTEDGEIKGVACGTANIKVTVGNASAACRVTVVQLVTSIRLNKNSAEMSAGDVLTLTANVYPSDAIDKRYCWSSSDPSVASVNEKGEVTALAKGEAQITATALDGSEVFGSCKITVTSKMFTASDVTQLQSPHPYENNCSDSWQYTLNGASKLNVRFNEETEMEDGFDYIRLYDKNNTLVGTYTGKELAGKTVSVTGDTIRIKLDTDKAGTAWGFAVDSVTKAEDSGTAEEDPGTGEENPDTGEEKPGTGEENPGIGEEKPGTETSTENKWDTEEPSDNTVAKPSVSKVKSFKAKAGNKKLTLSWKKLSGAAGYQIQVSAKKNFKGAKTITVSKSKKKYIKKGLKAKKKYYIRIRAYKTYKDANGKTQKAYGKWAAITKKTK